MDKVSVQNKVILLSFIWLRKLAQLFLEHKAKMAKGLDLKFCQFRLYKGKKIRTLQKHHIQSTGDQQ